ncbi:MAG: hypothetical protein QOC92_3515, partial [Acidimicrobiaceae bacterium]
MAEHQRACASCGSSNEEDARFCEGCGGALARVCGTCGVEANATARFCRACGAPLDKRVDATLDSTAAGPSRKTVTVMFADLAGSTTFEEQVDAETAREVMSRYHDLLRSIAERNRAGVTKYIGDGFMAVWGVPEVGPDDAGRAVDAAVELQERFVDFAARVSQTQGVDLALRVAVNTGEVVVGAGDADLVGDALNVAARLEAECPRGHVVVGEETWRSTRAGHRYESLGQVQVKGRTAPVVVYQWLGRQSEATDAAPFVGRAGEVRRLQSALDDAMAAQAARLVTVIGDPGVGKSRLAAEFTGTQVDARVIEARCDVEGTVALGPIVEVLRARDLDADVPVGVPERDRILRDLNGLTAGVPGSVEETFWALRRYVEMLARDGPLVIVVDDIQWADTLLLDFVEHLAEWVQEVPVLVLALARPELREARPDLVTVSRWVTEAVHLAGLDPGATAELAASVLGAARLPADLMGRLPSSTGGNPLFVRELVGMLVHDGVLVAEPAGWRLTIDVDAIAIPPTIQALLASRLERLNAADRRMLEIASVVGTDFSLGAVCALAERGSAEVKGSLDRLRRLDLAQPSGAYLGDEPVWRFHHVLIRDVAYRRLLKSDRADLHERLGNWVESGGASAAFDSDEMVARHLEAAHGYRLELGTADEHTGQLALRSARCYLASARRALDRDELISAGTQAARGAALAAADNAVHAELLLVGCEAFLSAGDVAAGAPLVDDLDRIADEALAPWATCYRCQFVVYTDPTRLLEVDARLQSAIDEFGRRKDPAGLAKAHRVRASARARLGRIGDAEVDLFEALIAARQGGDHRQITAALGMAPSAALWGPSPVPKAGGRCLDVVRMQRMTTAAPSLEATSLRCLAVLELLRGRPDKARSMLADARQVVADLGLRHGLMETELFAGFIEAMVGDQVAAEPHFRTAMEGMDALGVGADAGQAAALLARSVLAQGRIEEADRYATESERMAGHNLKTAIAWRAVRAEILAAQGRNDEAAAMARDAVNVAVGTDLVLDHAEACLALSRVLTAAGDAKGAKDARDDTHRLYGAKEVATAIGRLTEPNVPVASQPTPIAPAPTTSRLAVTNQSCEFLPALLTAVRSRDVDGTLSAFSDGFVFDDRRRITGDPIVGLTAMRAAIERIFEQYTQFEFRVLAVRGQRLNLLWSRWSDDDGNESTMLYVNETGDDGRIDYQGDFDEDDFLGAYRELERRYYAGEGAAFAPNGRPVTSWMESLNRVDVETARRLAHPNFRWIAPPSSLKASERSVDELFRWLQERANQVSSLQHSNAVLRWLSPNCNLSLGTVRAVGFDGEAYEWTRIYVSEWREGLLASVREFETDDEDAAFAYAETLVAPRSSRLAIANRASEIVDASCLAMQAHDIDRAIAVQSDRFVYDDRRRLSGDPVEGIAEARRATERLLEQYPHLDWRIRAVRGDRLALVWIRGSDDAGNEATYFAVIEVDDGQVTRHIRFDGEDFDGAYRELEHRYYADEGAAFALNGRVLTEFMEASNRLDADAARRLVQHDFRWRATPSAMTTGEHSVDDLFRWLRERRRQVSSVRNWASVVRWLSPDVCIGLTDSRALGLDGEDYGWTRLYVCNYRDGLVASVQQVDLDDEDAAFAYAESLVRPQSSRLAVSNRASESVAALIVAMQAHDLDAYIALHSDRFAYDDRRQLSGDPVVGLAEFRTASERFIEQYPRVEWRTLAVRGGRLSLEWTRWSDDAGNETTYLAVFEVDDDGRITRHVRFDGDDTDAAYRELDRRYYAGEGAPFALSGQVVNGMLAAMDRLDVDAARSLVQPEFRWLATPSAVLSNDLDLSVDEFFLWVQERGRQVSSLKHGLKAMRWVSPNCCIALGDIRANGLDGENYEWANLCVGEFRGGLLASVRQFGLDEEDAAFAYAESLITQRRSRLEVTNRASQALEQAVKAMQANDAHTTIGCYADPFTYDDRRRISGDSIGDLTGLLAAAERILAQYNRFDNRTLAVRGEFLQLSWSRWADDAGNETTNLRLIEVDDDGRIAYEGRFDEDDFEGAYRELERRYYAGEGAEFAEQGAKLTEAVIAHNRGDLARVFDELCAPELRIENRSRSAFPNRSAAELRASTEELQAMFASVRMCYSAVCWLSRNWAVARQDREAVGSDGERYEWVQLYVTEFRDGLVTSIWAFDIEDEEAAFAYAEERMRATTSRLALTNRASELIHSLLPAFEARDVDATVAVYADQFDFDDHRRLSGDPIMDRAAMGAATERILEQYNDFEGRTLAVRGERLALFWSRWSDDSGNETTYLHVFEIGDDGLITYNGRFDEDDFEGAYRELERRYYAGEGAEFAEQGAVGTEWVMALNRGDFDRVFNELTHPFMRVENRSLSVFGDPSAAELRATFEELYAMVASARAWSAAVCWLSPTWGVARFEREAVGRDGEKYAWARLQVIEFRDGRLASLCRFEVDDEEAAFAYAEEQVRAAASRLALANRATEVGDRLLAAFRERNVDAALDAHSDQFVYNDRRRLTGDPLVGRPGLRAAHERVFEQYSVFEGRTLAVRGERLQLSWSRWSDDAGNETTNLHVFEVGDDARITYHGRFEEDDFASAYRELERRYYAGEGSEFAEAGAVATDWILALNRGDFDRAFGELSTPDMRVENRSRVLFPDRSAAELRASFEELSAMVASARTWISAMHWVSPTMQVFRLEREAVGQDGEAYQWLRLHACEIQNGRLGSVCQFEMADEEQAFAYAEERARAAPSRLAVTNRSCDTVRAMGKAHLARDGDDFIRWCSDGLVYDDRRRLSGDPIPDRDEFRAAFERVLKQYSRFEWRILAVRGDHLNLHRLVRSDDAGNETAYLQVFDIGDDGRLNYVCRFDEDDFDGAYRELERRYYAGEGATYAESGALNVDYTIALNRGDFDTMFGELTTPDMHVQNRSRSVFPDRSAAELRASLEELNAMVASARNWQSAILWLSPNWAVARQQRDAVGLDGERYEWTRFLVAEYRDGRLASLCDFDVQDEEAAIAYAEERVRAAASRLAVSNRASEVMNHLARAFEARDADAIGAAYSEQFVFDDHRRLSGDPIEDRAGMRAASERIYGQYSVFEGRTLAVRGQRMGLFWSRWADDSGNETTYLHVIELGDDGRIVYNGRFDEDDFEGAYRELERRYYAGEGAAFAEAGATATEYVIAYNQNDFDRLLNDLTAPEMQFENRSRSVFPDRTIAEFRASVEELSAMVSSARTWYSAVRWLSPTLAVGRFDREAVGQDGEQYAWSRIYVNEIRDGRTVLSCQFDVEDEEAAFAYAEEHVRAASSRPAVANRASKIVEAGWRAMQAHDVDALVARYSDRFEYDDRRRLSGGPRDTPAALRLAAARILEQYPHFEWRRLAVRGERLELDSSRWWDEAGNETTALHVFEIGDDGRITYDGRFDEDDFEGAYRELERRYYAGEGAAFAVGGVVQTEWITALNRGDLDRIGDLYGPEMRVENRSRTGFPDRSASDLRASFAELNAMVASTRTWPSAVCWVSPRWNVTRLERKAVGTDGEQYDWTRLLVNEFRDGLVMFSSEFEPEDEEAAFAYAEERIRATSSRLAVTNRSCETTRAIINAMQAHDTDGFMSCCSDRLVYDDRRRLSGDPIHGDAEFRVAFERI